jgi:cytochrome c-type biogenesis protein
MIEGQFAYVFGVGMVAAFNPCGFAMLPAYLAYFTGVEDDSPDTFVAVRRALLVGAVMTAGFVLVFAGAGMVIEWISGEFQSQLWWITILIGLGLIAVGAFYASGRELILRLPHVERGGDSRELRSMFLFGVSYAVASLGCTIPTFLVAVSRSFRVESYVSGVASFVVYALGMGVVITFVTVCVAMAKHGLVARLRRVLPYVGRVAGVLLILAGAYTVWFGWWERAVRTDAEIGDGPISVVNDVSDSIGDWVLDFGAVRLGLVLAGVTAMLAVLAWGWRASREPRSAVDS